MAIAGAVSRPCVSPFETLRAHLMVGWTGLFRGNLANFIRVAPCKAIELFAYDTVKKSLTPKHGEKSKA
ncbi:hypothetical protein R6Q57_008642 [Mikania cordata]